MDRAHRPASGPEIFYCLWTAAQSAIWESILRILYRTGQNGSILYGLMSGLQAREVTLQLVPKPLMDAKDGLRILLAFLLPGIGLYVILRGRRLSRAFHFYLICLAAFVAVLYSYTPKMGRIGPMGLRSFDHVLSGASAAVPPLLSSFSRGSGTRSQSRAVSLHSGGISGRAAPVLDSGAPGWNGPAARCAVTRHPGPSCNSCIFVPAS